jgi:hypothetical protein
MHIEAIHVVVAKGFDDAHWSIEAIMLLRWAPTLTLLQGVEDWALDGICISFAPLSLQIQHDTCGVPTTSHVDC